MKKFVISVLCLAALFISMGCDITMEDKVLKEDFSPENMLPFSDLLAGQDETSKSIDYNQFNGLRVKLPGYGAIFLVDRGKRRAIPNPETYNNLFRDWTGIYEGIDVGDIPLGTGITNGAFLATAKNTRGVFLIDNGQKRGIASPAVMDQYWFAWNKIQTVNALILSYVPSGPGIY